MISILTIIERFVEVSGRSQVRFDSIAVWVEVWRDPLANEFHLPFADFMRNIARCLSWIAYAL